MPFIEAHRNIVRNGSHGPRLRRRTAAAFTLVEVMVAAAVLALTTLTATQVLLRLNRQAALIRVINAAKAEALSRIQQVSQSAYAPNADTPVIPDLLKVRTTTTNIDLGGAASTTDTAPTDLGHIPATVTWTVASVGGSSGIVSVRCNISYTYLNRNLSYELFTYKAPD